MQTIDLRKADKMVKQNINLIPGIRMIVAAIVMISILSPGLANAFALGPIRVTGDFNKQFKAEVPVLTNGKEGLKAWIGDKRDYRKVGIERPPFLDNLSMQVKDHPTLPGQKIIYIISREPIYQPSFNLLLKASMGKGTILKNYFLAVDFQKNLNLALPSARDEEKEEMARIAKEFKKIKKSTKPAKMPEKLQRRREKELATLDQIREEERKAVRRDEAREAMIQKGKRDEPIKIVKAPEPKKPPVAIKSPPKPAPKPKQMKEEIQKSPVAVVEAPIAQKSAQPVERMGGAFLPISNIAIENRYEAVRGDSLYKIVKKLGASRRNYNRVVVAIWRENSDSFIKGNIHGLKAGADLDYDKVNETARLITDAEARKIIDSQWPAWVESRAKYLDRVRQRARIQSGIGLKSNTLALMANKKPEPVTKESAQESKGAKTIGAAKKEKGAEGRPYVAHIASYKKRQAARRFAKWLRSKGYEAFVSLNFIHGKGYWHRVLVNRFESKADAARVTQKVRKLGISKYSRVLKLPYAVKVGNSFSGAESSKRIEELASKGVFGYVLTAMEKNSEGVFPINIYVGAFGTEKEALEAVKRLNASGFKCEVVKP